MTMRKLTYFAALVVAMTAVSCAQEIDAPVVEDAVTFTASFDAAASKAVLKPGADESKVEWESGDQVSVFAAGANYLFVAQTPGASTTLTTEATGVPTEGEFYAVYPYDADATLAEGVITTELPAEQTAVLGSFSTHLAVAQANGTTLAFKNVCGLVKVNVSAENVTKIVLEGNSGEVVAGAINVTVADAPTWTAVAEQGATSVSLAAASGTLAKGDYYFAVLPQTFAAGFKVTAYKGETASVIRNVTTEVTIARADIVAGKSFGIDGEGTEASPYILKTAQDIVDMRSLAKLGGETWFKMANDIDMTPVTNWVPVNFDGTFSRQIHFDGNNKTISNFAPATWKYLAEPEEGSESTELVETDSRYHSLFGVLYGSVKNLTINNVTITGSNACGVIGGYVGTEGKPGSVENVTITNATVTVTSTGDRAGGVCGNAKEATFKNVSFQGSVSTSYSKDASRSGGFAGHTEITAVFENCSADVRVTGESNDVGGFVGKTTGNVEFEKCNVKAVVNFNAITQNRCGGFIGWNAATESTITDCHVLAGSSITSTTTGPYLGGFIGYADADATTKVEIANCSSEANVNSPSSSESSVFIGIIGYDPVVNITDCYAKGDIITSKNYIGGIVGRVNKAVVTITKCNFQGNLKGASGVAGLVGGVEGGTVSIYKSYAKGSVTATAHNTGGLLGLGNGPIIVENSYADVTFTQTGGQFGGGIVGSGQNTVLSIKNCFTTGTMVVSRGVGGIVGRAEGTETTEVQNCISWISNIKTNRGDTQYSVGAVVGVDRDKVANFKSCYRRADMVLEDVIMTLTDHDDVVDGLPVYPSYTTSDNNQRAYHGKAAAADATISSVAKSIGWDETIWDLSKDVPALK